MKNIAKHFIFIYHISHQITWTCCQQQNDYKQDFWVSEETNPSDELNQMKGLSSNFLKDINENKKSLNNNNFGKLTSDENTRIKYDNDYDYSSDYHTYKRDAQNRRENAKRRKLAKHNNLFQKFIKMRQDRNKNKETRIKYKNVLNKVKDDILEKELNGKQSKYPKISPSLNKENNVENPRIKEYLTQENAKPPTVNGSTHTGNLKVLVKDDNFKTVTNTSIHSGSHSYADKQNKWHKNGLMFPSAEQKSTKKDKKIETHLQNLNGNRHNKFLQTNNTDEERENKQNNEYLEKLGAINTNKLNGVEINKSMEDSKQQELDGISYTNVSTINKGIKNALEKKYSCFKNGKNPNKEIIIPNKSAWLETIPKSHKFTDVQDQDDYYNDENQEIEEKNTPLEEDKFFVDENESSNVNLNRINFNYKTGEENSDDQCNNVSEENSVTSRNEIINGSSCGSDVHTNEDNIKSEVDTFEDGNHNESGKLLAQITSKTSSKTLPNKKHARHAKKKAQHTKPDESVTGTDKSSDILQNLKSKSTENDVSVNISSDTNEIGKPKREERGIKKRKQKSDTSARRNMFSSRKDDNKNNEYDYIEPLEDNQGFMEDDVFNSANQHKVQTKNKESLKKPSQDRIERVSEEESLITENNFKTPFERRFHEPEHSGDQCNDKDSNCLNSYKAEKSTSESNREVTKINLVTPSACSSIASTLTVTPTTPLVKQSNVSEKTKTTSKTNLKNKPSKKKQSELHTNSTPDDEIDIYEQFLCGKLVDDFVDLVLLKVKKSRKIYKELGFRNDTEETCDRCIETKFQKIPSLETMKTSIGKCLQKDEQISACNTCYSVPKPMEKFLNLLISFEIEHENSAYNKIRDDSSFIFTGDYTDRLTKSENTYENNDKYVGYRNSLNKETFEKQHLIEDHNEEKSVNQMTNKNSLDNLSRHALNQNKNVIEHSTEPVADENEGEEISVETKPVIDKNPAVIKEPKTGNSEKKMLPELGNKVKDSDPLEEELDISVPFNYKQVDYKDLGVVKPGHIPSGSNSVRRRKAFNTAKLKNPKKSYPVMEPEDLTVDRNKGDRKKHFGSISSSPSKSKHTLENPLKREHNIHSSPSRQEIFQKYRSPDRNTHSWSYNNNPFLPLNSPANTKYSKQTDYFDYPLEKNVENSPSRNLNRNEEQKQSVMNEDWELNEYDELVPKRNPEYDASNTISRQRLRNNDYIDRLNMVKRDAEENYEDPLFFELPNVEYDLY